ncbi:PREDICTED: uncharacterized protein LOC105973459 isoform X2 [Erythranthe guttata]|uniref:uncharacterized protein LOC105973459 isoform X2 n=1 Tax=Erythranthe guttata TaxID=4155 RepID=UPI00064E04CF|nr:PREDICTED: uncharacterized protein LOC105973459 isoform X2 [Erythranthe guttata]|eukprot:XP_012853936.1 PREDICTED: uncharacterized protein LOC105973459 isoform X2 [Erythranthe guttata]
MVSKGKVSATTLNRFSCIALAGGNSVSLWYCRRRPFEYQHVKVICDHVSRKSRGYKFVHYSSEMMGCQLLDGRKYRHFLWPRRAKAIKSD